MLDTSRPAARASFTAEVMRAVRAAPAHHQQLAAIGEPFTSTGGSSCAMRATFSARSSTMRCVVRGSVRDVAGQLLVLEPADAVLEARRARDRPRSRERLGVARVGLEALRVGAVLHRRTRQRRRVGDQPGLGAVREVAVREHDHRRHVPHRDAEGLEHDRGSSRRAWPARAPATGLSRVAAVEREQQVAPARSSWACPSTGRRAGCRPPRAAARPSPRGRAPPASARSRARSWCRWRGGRRRTRRSRADAAAISSSAWKVFTPKCR